MISPESNTDLLTTASDSYDCSDFCKRLWKYKLRMFICWWVEKRPSKYQDFAHGWEFQWHIQKESKWTVDLRTNLLFYQSKNESKHIIQWETDTSIPMIYMKILNTDMHLKASRYPLCDQKTLPRKLKITLSTITKSNMFLIWLLR